MQVNWPSSTYARAPDRRYASYAVQCFPAGFLKLTAKVLFLVMLFAGLMMLGAAQAQESRVTGFDHDATSFPLRGGHTGAECTQCHIGGQLSGTPTDCVACHDSKIATGKSSTHPPASKNCNSCHATANWVPIDFDHDFVSGDCADCHNGKSASGKSRSHFPTNDTCEDCHITQTWTQVRFNHSAALGSCSTCHNGVTATGKGANHIPAASTCDDCHVTTNWTTVRFDHAAVTGSCSTCHNGVTATGKGANHIPSANSCDDCHVTTNWTTVRFDHAAVTGSCSTCHNGVTATGKGANHIVSSTTCDACHISTTAWTSVRFDHNEVTGSCSSCHNGVAATGKGASHFVTTQQCDSCHRTTSWFSVSYSHLTGAVPSGHSTTICSQCHTTNSEQQAYRFPNYKPDCAGCHANDYKSGPHKKYEKPNTVFYRVDELRDCAGACHYYTDSTMTAIKERRSSEHRPTDGDF